MPLVKERPILFSGKMVNAILAGQKTQTRRIVEPPYEGSPLSAYEQNGRWFVAGGMGTKQACPYGEPGDRLWVRESFSLSGFHQDAENADADEVARPLVSVHYAADGTVRHNVRLTAAEGKKLRARVTDRQKTQPGRFMYKSCSRILLEIAGVRVERLNDITDSDAAAEGVATPWVGGPWPWICKHGTPWRSVGQADIAPHLLFKHLWESINGRGSWLFNPLVWVVTFKRLEMPEVGRD